VSRVCHVRFPAIEIERARGGASERAGWAGFKADAVFSKQLVCRAPIREFWPQLAILPHFLVIEEEERAESWRKGEHLIEHFNGDWYPHASPQIVFDGDRSLVNARVRVAGYAIGHPNRPGRIRLE